MKRFREFKTQGDFFYMEVNFLPENDEEEETFYDGLATQKSIITGGDCVLQLAWMLRYPKNPTSRVRIRFSALAHPNLSPVIVAEESAYFLSLINQMISTK